MSSGCIMYGAQVEFRPSSVIVLLLFVLFPLRFTPDFTSSRVIRELKLVTYGGSEFVFILNASLPYHMLASCAETLPRPSWELELYIIVAVIMR